MWCMISMVEKVIGYEDYKNEEQRLLLTVDFKTQASSVK